MNILFWIVWTMVAIATLIAFYFFIVGLGDGSIGSFNMGIWMLLMIGLPLLLAGTYWLKNHHYIKLAIGLLIIPALPILGYFIFLLVVILSGPVRWN